MGLHGEGGERARRRFDVRPGGEFPDVGSGDVVVFHPDGERRPLVMPLTWRGEHDTVAAFAAALGADQPLVVVTVPEAEEVHDFPRTLDAWVDHVLDGLAVADLRRSVDFVAWSFGGVIAAHVASDPRLAAMGLVDGRPFVVMLDSRNPGTRRKAPPPRSLPHSMLHHGARLFEMEPDERSDYLRTRARRVGERLRGRSQARTVDETPARDRLTKLQRAIWVAFLKYEPGPVDCDGALLWCDDSRLATDDLTLGWHRWWKGSLHAERIGDNHFGLFTDDMIPVVADRVRAVTPVR